MANKPSASSTGGTEWTIRLSHRTILIKPSTPPMPAWAHTSLAKIRSKNLPTLIRTFYQMARRAQFSRTSRKPMQILIKSLSMVATSLFAWLLLVTSIFRAITESPGGLFLLTRSSPSWDNKWKLMIKAPRHSDNGTQKKWTSHGEKTTASKLRPRKRTTWTGANTSAISSLDVSRKPWNQDSTMWSTWWALESSSKNK